MNISELGSQSIHSITYSVSQGAGLSASAQTLLPQGQNQNYTNTNTKPGSWVKNIGSNTNSAKLCSDSLFKDDGFACSCEDINEKHLQHLLNPISSLSNYYY